MGDVRRLIGNTTKIKCNVGGTAFTVRARSLTLRRRTPGNPYFPVYVGVLIATLTPADVPLDECLLGFLDASSSWHALVVDD
jgi:hypothetical protein